ncbi:MAG: N-acetylmuramoyl-L-alanine amidase [Candidatus Eremiobacteraeota bacterium]|nr:N-acetylmuramoyl-L-alanine amidase [Candidatus Eremiobacteraeota bacterium]
MNWIRRFAVPIGSAAALLLWLLISGLPARAQTATYVYRNAPVAFTHLANNNGSLAVGINDPGLRALLREVGAVITWRPGERYVLITTSEPMVINFSVGDTRYDVGPLSAQAANAPYVGADNEVYLPLTELLSSLYIAAKQDGSTTVLQPQLASVDVQGSGSQAVLIARGGAPLHARVVDDAGDRVVYEFAGVGSTLARSRSVNAGGIRSLEVATSGTVRDPKTLVTVFLNPGSRHGAPRSSSGDFEVAFGSNGGAPPLIAGQRASSPAAEEPPAEATPGAPTQQPAQSATVTSVTVSPKSDGATVNVAVSGDATFQWHRLRDPDNRFWIDIKDAQLAGPAREEAQSDPLVSLRARQNDAQTVRIALSLAGSTAIAVSPSATGVSITVLRAAADDAVARSGEGSIGSIVAVNEPQALVTPVPPDMYGPSTPAPEGWKYVPRTSYVAANPKLIVIDPGHGGSDPGSARNGIKEADLALDMARRLKQILISRGWQVRMTRETDVDVYAPNDSARDELQARDNIANSAGARMFISIHANAFINSGPNGTTTYYSKPIDLGLARIIDRNLASTIGTKDDGVIKARYYVTLHASMPAVLIETAFISNPDDFERLASPDWRGRVAQAIAVSVDQYAQANPVSNSGGQ